jgi:hypothetical protein
MKLSEQLRDIREHCPVQFGFARAGLKAAADRLDELEGREHYQKFERIWVRLRDLELWQDGQGKDLGKRLKKLEKGHENHGWRISALECPSEMTLQFEKDIAKLKDIVNEIDLYIQSQLGLTERVEKLEKIHSHKLIFDRIALVERDLSDLTAAHDDFVDNHYLYKPKHEESTPEKPKTCGECKHLLTNYLGATGCCRLPRSGAWMLLDKRTEACDKWEAK